MPEASAAVAQARETLVRLGATPLLARLDRDLEAVETRPSRPAIGSEEITQQSPVNG